MISYGMPYMGSKSKIAEWVIENLPAADNLYDLFGGGGAVTDCAAQSGKYKQIFYNDIDPVTAKGFSMAIAGKFDDEKRWISREEFSKLKNHDPYVKMCFSYGNDGRTYAYSPQSEFYKKALHYAVMFCEPRPLENVTGLNFSSIANESTMGGRMSAIREVLRAAGRDDRLQNYERLRRLQSLQQFQSVESLQRLQRLQRLQKCRIEIYNADYRAVNILPNSVIYCDIPYFGTKKYTHDIDHSKFYTWCRRQTAPVYISSYQIDVPGFEVVAEIEKRVNMDIRQSKNQFKIERLYKYRRS